MRQYELMVILDPELEERTVAPQPRPVPQRRPPGRRHRREGRHLGPSPAGVRDQEEDRGHLRRRRPDGRAGRRQGARPPAQPQRVRAAHQGPAVPEPSARRAAWPATPSSPSSATSPTTPSCGSPRAVPRSRTSPSRRRRACSTGRPTSGRTATPLFLRCTVWRQAAENVAESLTARHAGHRHRPAQAAVVRDQGRREAHRRRARGRRGRPVAALRHRQGHKVSRGGGGGGGFGGGGGGGGGRRRPWRRSGGRRRRRRLRRRRRRPLATARRLRPAPAAGRTTSPPSRPTSYRLERLP